MTKFEKLAQMKKEYEVACKDVGKKGVVELLNEFFTDNPQINAVKWRQYTPYFNDGDTCEFSLHGVYFQLVDPKSFNLTEDGGDYEDGFYSSWDVEYENKAKGAKTLAKNMKGIENILDSSADVLNVAFGDHMEILVQRDGNVEVEDYEHD
jgi:hypothetical protein